MYLFIDEDGYVTKGELCAWTPLSERSHPKNRNFVAAWFDPEGYLDGVEWLTWDGQSYWNLNSNNKNEFGGKKQIQMFTHWMFVPETLST